MGVRGRQKNLSLAITVWHHSACRVMPDCDREGWIFLSTPYTNDRFFYSFERSVLSSTVCSHENIVYMQAIIAAAMTDKSPFVAPVGKQDTANLAKQALAIASSDQLTVYKSYLG